MKKYILLFVLCCIPLGLFAQMNISRVQQIIYEDVVEEEKVSYISPVSFWYSLYSMHIFLANEYQSINLVSSSYQYVDLIFSLRDLISYNIIDLLEFELDKSSAMDLYVSKLDLCLLESDIILTNIREEMSLLDYSLQSCLSQKEISDKQYLDSINSPYQQIFLQESIDDSKKYAQCVSDARIEYNAKKILLDKIVAYRWILKIKYDYLSKNKEDIVKYYNLIKSDVLEDLLMIKRMLEKYDM